MVLNNEDKSVIYNGQSFQYTLKQTAEPLVILPTLDQDWTFCPNTCTFSERSNSGIDSSVVNFAPHNGAFQINSNDKTLHNTQVDLTLECRSSFATESETSVFDFSFVFYDECWDAQLTPPFSSGIDAPLFLENSLVYTKPSTAAECGAFEDSLTFLNADENMPEIELDAGMDGMIRVMGTDPVEHTGEHYVRIKSCITVFENGLPTVCSRCCTDSDPFVVKLFNACDGSEIQT